MPRRDPHPHRSDPETTFDTWLDAFVAGTPAGAASRDDGTGLLARAQAGARQLHGLAARSAMPGTAAQRRIEEVLMDGGALAASRGGSAWIPEERQVTRVRWWSSASPVLATAMAIAVILALVGSLIWTQRPVLSPTPDGNPGFAVASPGASSESMAQVSDLLIVRGLPTDEAQALSDRVGVIDDGGLTIYQPDGTIKLDGASEVIPTGVPGQALVTWSGGQRSVVDLTTGNDVFDLPDVAEREGRGGSYLFVSESGENADWMIYDLRNGESRPLAEIVDLPADQPAIPTSFGPYTVDSDTVFMQFVSPEYETSPTSDIPSFVIAGSLDRASTLGGYPPASQARMSLPVTSQDGALVAWVARYPENAIVVAETTTGAELARYELGDVSPDAIPAGFTSDERQLVVTTYDRVLLLGWADGDMDIEIVDEGLGGISNPLFYAPTGSLYYHEDEALVRMMIPQGGVTTILPEFSTQYPSSFTAPGTPWIVANPSGNATLIDARTGEIVSRLSDVPANEAAFNAFTSSTSFDGSTVIQEIGGSNSGYLVSPVYPEGLVLSAPIDPDVIAESDTPDGIPVKYTLSADGSTVVAGVIGSGGYAPQIMAPVEPDPEWTPILSGVDNFYWIPMPAIDSDEDDTETLPALDIATPVATPAATPEDGAFVTSIEVTAKDDIYISVVADGVPVFEGDLAAGESTGPMIGSMFEVYTTSGANTAFTNACGDSPFNMGYEPGEAYYILEANESSCPPAASPVATPEAAVDPARMIVVTGSPAEARIEGELAIATLSEDPSIGLTLPLASGEPIRLGRVTQVNPIWWANVPGRSLIVRPDGSAAVIDLATGVVLFDVPSAAMWIRDTGSYRFRSWRFIPANDQLTDWTIMDLTTGDTVRLSELFTIPADTTVMPLPHGDAYGGGVPLIEIQPVSIEDTDYTPVGDPVVTFAIAGSLDRAVALPDYPDPLDSVGEPAVLARSDGHTLAYETRAAESRIVMVDATTGEELARFGVDSVGDDPTLAGFTEDGDHVAVTTEDRVMLLNWRGDPPFTVMEGLDSIADPLLYVPDAVLYFRQANSLMRLDMPTGELTEVVTDLVLAPPFDVSKPGSNWLVVQTHDGHVLIDARTGEVASRLKAPGNLSMLPVRSDWPLWLSDGDGDTVIFALARASMPPPMHAATPAVWLLSPEYPDGLEIAAPDNAQGYWLAEDGMTVYAFASESQGGPGDVWSMPLGPEPAWTRIAEDVDQVSGPPDLAG